MQSLPVQDFRIAFLTTAVATGAALLGFTAAFAAIRAAPRRGPEDERNVRTHGPMATISGSLSDAPLRMVDAVAIDFVLWPSGTALCGGLVPLLLLATGNLNHEAAYRISSGTMAVVLFISGIYLRRVTNRVLTDELKRGRDGFRLTLWIRYFALPLHWIVTFSLAANLAVGAFWPYGTFLCFSITVSAIQFMMAVRLVAYRGAIQLAGLSITDPRDTFLK
jgi:hypothetical protein